MGYRKNRKSEKVIVLRPKEYYGNLNAFVKVRLSSETPYTWFGKPIDWNKGIWAFDKNIEYAFLKKKWRKVK